MKNANTGPGNFLKNLSQHIWPIHASNEPGKKGINSVKVRSPNQNSGLAIHQTGVIARATHNEASIREIRIWCFFMFALGAIAMALNPL